MITPEYMFLPADLIPSSFFHHYQLHKHLHHNKIYIQVTKGMYGLPQAGRLAYDQLQKHIHYYGYQPIPHTTGLWKHKTLPIQFTLVVDDFGIKYNGIEHLHHLHSALKDLYPQVTLDLSASSYCGFHLNWDYSQHTVTLTMPHYIPNLLHRLQHKPPVKPQHSPYPQKFPVPIPTTIPNYSVRDIQHI